jgi:hypothetical protein
MHEVAKTLLSKEIRICSDTSGLHGFLTLYRDSHHDGHIFGSFRSDGGEEYTLLASPSLRQLWGEDTDYALISGLQVEVDRTQGTLRIDHYLCIHSLESPAEVACAFQIG